MTIQVGKVGMYQITVSYLIFEEMPNIEDFEVKFVRAD